MGIPLNMTIDAVRDVYESGATYAELMRRHSISRRRIAGIRHGNIAASITKGMVKSPRRGTEKTAAIRHVLLTDRARQYKDVADQFKVSRSHVSGIARRAGLLRQTGGTRPVTVDHQMIIALVRAAQLNMREIADRVGCDRSYVAVIAHRNGLTYVPPIRSAKPRTKRRARRTEVPDMKEANQKAKTTEILRRPTRMPLSPFVDWDLVVAHYRKSNGAPFADPKPAWVEHFTPGYCRKEAGPITVRVYHVRDWPGLPKKDA